MIGKFLLMSPLTLDIYRAHITSAMQLCTVITERCNVCSHRVLYLHKFAFFDCVRRINENKHYVNRPKLKGIRINENKHYVNRLKLKRIRIQDSQK